MQKPYLNLGCGRIILPGEQPLHHALVDSAIYQYALWTNADRNAEPGVDCVVNLFHYPWPFEDSSFDGALLAHLVEHIPHEIRTNGRGSSARVEELASCQDGWYAFFSELYRVLTPGAVAHILAPYGWSQGAITDPTHTRMITEHSFTHSMKPEENNAFQYDNGGIHFEVAEPPKFHPTEMFQHLTNNEPLFRMALQTQINVVYELYVKLRAVK